MIIYTIPYQVAIGGCCVCVCVIYQPIGSTHTLVEKIKLVNPIATTMASCRFSISLEVFEGCWLPGRENGRWNEGREGKREGEGGREREREREGGKEGGRGEGEEGWEGKREEGWEKGEAGKGRGGEGS